MRMWLVPPSVLCNQHLLGEHLEMHMFVGTINKGISIKGYIENGLLDPKLIVSRHNILVIEMTKRGMRHKSPLEDPVQPFIGANFVSRVDVDENYKELSYRCSACAGLQRAHVIAMSNNRCSCCGGISRGSDAVLDPLPDGGYLERCPFCGSSEVNIV